MVRLSLWDDNFVNNWTIVSGSASSDGDIISIGSGGEIKRSLSFSRNPHRYIIIKVTDGTGDHATVSVWKSGVSLYSINIYNVGITTIDLNSASYDDFDEIHLSTPAGSTCKIDYIAVCKKTLLVPVDSADPTVPCKVVDEMTVTLPSLVSGVGGFTLKFKNFSGEFTDQIGAFDIILIYLYRKGATVKKVFGGRIIEPGYEGSGSSQQYYVTCSGMDFAQQLQAPPSILDKYYRQVNGRTIITDAIALCPLLSSKFVDVDQDIESLHDFEFLEKIPYDAVVDVLKVAKTLGGVVGFDGYCDPAGNMNVFRRGKYVSQVVLPQLDIDIYSKKEDALRIVNKQRVYGIWSESCQIPDNDVWCEDLLNWSVYTGFGTLSLDNADKKVGNYAVKGTAALSAGLYSLAFRRTFEPDGTVIDCVNKTTNASFGVLHFWLKCSISGAAGIYLYLLDPDGGIKNAIPLTPSANVWTEYTIIFGQDNYGQHWAQGNDSSAFQNVAYILFSYLLQGSSFTILVDDLYFKNGRFRATKENKISQAKYGIIVGKPEVDDKLTSNAECGKKADSLLDFHRDKIIKFTLTVDGDNGYLPGYKQRVTLTNDNIDEWFRIELKHIVKGVDWTTDLLSVTSLRWLITILLLQVLRRKAALA